VRDPILVMAARAEEEGTIQMQFERMPGRDERYP
jgi:hypothetical protein